MTEGGCPRDPKTSVESELCSPQSPSTDVCRSGPREDSQFPLSKLQGYGNDESRAGGLVQEFTLKQKTLVVGDLRPVSTKDTLGQTDVRVLGTFYFRFYSTREMGPRSGVTHNFFPSLNPLRLPPNPFLLLS